MPRITKKPQVEAGRYLVKSEHVHLYMKGAFFVVMLLFAYAAILYANSFARQGVPLQNLPSFSVSGEGKIVAIPDVAKFTFSVITEGGLGIADLQTVNSQKVNQAIAYLKNNSVDVKDIQTQGYNISPRYEYGNCPPRESACPPPSIVGYSISQTVEVKVRDLAQVGSVISNVVNNGANSVSQLDFVIDDPENIKEQASAKAIARAREKAQKMAEMGGFRIGKLLNIYESSSTPYPYAQIGLGGGVMEKSTPAAPPTIEPGSQEVVSNVTLQFEIVK